MDTEILAQEDRGPVRFFAVKVNTISDMGVYQPGDIKIVARRVSGTYKKPQDDWKYITIDENNEIFYTGLNWAGLSEDNTKQYVPEKCQICWEPFSGREILYACDGIQKLEENCRQRNSDPNVQCCQDCKDVIESQVGTLSSDFMATIVSQSI